MPTTTQFHSTKTQQFSGIGLQVLAQFRAG